MTDGAEFMLGFRPQKPGRAPLYSTSGQKMGYLERDPAGHCFVQNVEGARIARILRYKTETAAISCSVGAQGSTFVHADLTLEY